MLESLKQSLHFVGENASRWDYSHWAGEYGARTLNSVQHTVLPKLLKTGVMDSDQNAPHSRAFVLSWSGRLDLNQRPLAPKARAQIDDKRFVFYKHLKSLETRLASGKGSLSQVWRYGPGVSLTVEGCPRLSIFGGEMPRINVEDEWFDDPRRELLKGFVGEAVDTVALAMWRLSQRYYRLEILVVPVEKFELMAHWDAFEKAKLARRENGGVYICGSRDRFSWLSEQRERGRLGGLARASQRLANAKPFLPSSSSSSSNNKEEVGQSKAQVEKIQLSPEGKWLFLTEEKKGFWRAIYPGVDVDRELGAAAAWIIANPAKAKKNYERFLNGWLSRTFKSLKPVSIHQFSGKPRYLIELEKKREAN